MVPEGGGAWFNGGQYNLGICYYEGQGLENDDTEAVKWFLKAAEQRHNDAMQNLAQCCRHGFGVEQDETEADRWDELAEAAAEHEEEHDDDDEDI